MVIILKAVQPKDAAFVKLIETRIKSLKFEDVDAGQDSLTLTVDNSDVVLLDTPGFLDATEILIQWGDIGNLTEQRKIKLKKITGFQTLEISGTGVLWSFDQVPVKRLWELQDITEIIHKLALEMGFERPDIQQPEAYYFDSFQQYEPNARFIARLARLVGYSFWIDSNFHWRARDAKGKTITTLVYKGTLEPSMPGYIIGEPSVKFELRRDDPEAVKATAAVDKTLNKDPTKANSGFMNMLTTRPGKPARFVMKGYGNLVYESKQEQRVNVFAEGLKLLSKYTTKVYAPSGKPTKAAGIWRGGQDKKHKMEVKIRGLGFLTIGALMELANMGKMNEGKWYIKKIVHEVTSSGFTQNLELTRNSGKMGKAAVAGKVNTSKSDALFGPPLSEFTTETAIVKDADGNMKTIQRQVPTKLDGVSIQFKNYWGKLP
jgi:hypothetical protein